MKVLFWSPGFWPGLGGVERLARDLLLALEQEGFRFEVVTETKGPANMGTIPIHRVSMKNRLQSPAELAANKRILRRIKRTFAPDLIHLFAPGLDAIFHLMTDTGTPTLLSLHGRWLEHEGSNTVLTHALDRADRVTTCSSWLREKVLNFAPDVGEKTTTLLNGIPWVKPNEEKRAGRYRVACLGRLSEEKGFDVVIRAFAKLQKQQAQAQLHLAGDGPEEPALKRLARDLELKVFFRGRLEPKEVPRWLNEASVVVVPSRTEGFGLVALEAALAARPVVASNVGGLREVICSEETGLLVEPDKPELLAEAILKLLEQPEFAKSLGQKAKERATQLYSWESYVSKHKIIYEELISK